jgi:hemerythrin-like metal-binding protein
MHIGWNEALATGIEAIDGLQRELFRVAAQLVEAARAQQAPQARAHVARLSELAKVLFEEEERTLREAGAASLERHTGEHRRFLTDLAVLSRELGRRGPEALTDLRVARHIAAWLEAHVGRTDRELGEGGAT